MRKHRALPQLRTNRFPGRRGQDLNAASHVIRYTAEENHGILKVLDIGGDNNSELTGSWIVNAVPGAAHDLEVANRPARCMRWNLSGSPLAKQELVGSTTERGSWTPLVGTSVLLPCRSRQTSAMHVESPDT